VVEQAVRPPVPEGSSLVGRVAVVTGAAHGIGEATALALAGRGASVAVIDVDALAARRTVEAIEAAGSASMSCPCDVSDRRAVEETVDAITTRWGRLDILVSNAGSIHSGTGLLGTEDDEWRHTFAVHVEGALHVTRAAVPSLRRSPAGRILFTSSIWAQAAPGHSYAYCAAKGALIAFARNLAVELAPDGVCVNAIAPGGVHTRMAEALSPEELQTDIGTIPLRRYAEPREIGALVAFLASDAAAFLTGQTIGINGGQLIGAS
jgi:NAD(P)-dependent dehydrogenase (short-subunit alcohol dehydrogenase family)